MLAVSLRESQKIISCLWRDRAGANRAPRVPLTHRCAIEKKTTCRAAHTLVRARDELRLTAMPAELELQAPIFILAHARTGSTMLRYVLDSHPDVCCPAEIETAKLRHALYRVIEFTFGEVTPWDNLEDDRNH